MAMPREWTHPERRDGFAVLGPQPPPVPYRSSSTTGCTDHSTGRFRITHPFHPLRGTEYELVVRRTNWGEDRVFFYGPDGTLKSLLAGLTDVAPLDAFAHISASEIC